MFSHHKNHINLSLRCHHCGRYGHIRPYCFELYGYPQSYIQPRLKRKDGKHIQAMKEWKPKPVVNSFIYHTYLRVSSKEDWYFDSGCSRHMTGEKKYLEELKSYSNSYVTFDDGTNGIIKGICKMVSPGLPCINYVLLV